MSLITEFGRVSRAAVIARARELHAGVLTWQQAMAQAQSEASAALRSSEPKKVVQQECGQGHVLAAANLYEVPDGRRRCRKCVSEACERYRRRTAIQIERRAHA